MRKFRDLLSIGTTVTKRRSMLDGSSRSTWMRRFPEIRSISEFPHLAPEYSTMSRRPGIGSPWLAKWKRDVFPHDFCIMNGRKVRVPKAYDQLMINAETPIGDWVTDATGFPVWKPSIRSTPMEMTKRKRIRSAAKHSENQTRDRLDVIEELTQLRVDRLARS